MSLRELPEPRALSRPQNYQWDIPSGVLTSWAEGPQAAESQDEDTISIFDVIGHDFWTGGGFTAKRMSAALRSIGDKPVRVQINSPGGDLFEGIAIYSLLAKHKAKVTVEVLGWAASAASIIAMAGDEIVMGLGTFMMVHNAWGVVVGNRNDMREAADLFDQFDSAIVDIYEARTGRLRKDIEKLMDKETWLSPRDAVAQGFADRVDDGLTLPDQGDGSNAVDDHILARRQMEGALAKAGYPRSARSAMLGRLADPNSPAPRDAGRMTAARDAGEAVAHARELIDLMKV